MKAKRKMAVLVGDGMGDEPVAVLGNKTPLQAADIPAIRRAAALGHVQLVQTVPDGMAPGSDVANMGLLGYNAAEKYTGRAAIEAAGANLPLAPEDVAYRANLVTVENGKMVDYSAGDISSEEGRQLIEALNAAASREGFRFYGGVSYRHLLIWREGPTDVVLTPPHEISGRRVEAFLPSGPHGGDVRALMELSRRVFAEHPVNAERVAKGLRPATQIWLWGLGRAMALQPYPERYGRQGGIITAVDLIRGLAVLCGLDVIRVPGATGWIDTDYLGKARAAIDCLKQADFVYVHVEAPDECGHKGLAEEKVKAIENFSRQVVEPVWKALEMAGEPYRLIVCTDHRTPVNKRGHTSDPVPFAWVDGPLGSSMNPDASADFDEFIPPLPGKMPLVCDVMDSLLHSGPAS
ncbi:MAG: cofactor-independent phosphoglycerate mutase [Verrucomicrobiota bacterium]|jgi:2,3-bisphosphoglycerate-independent phosphoglycerate mutase|nr:cofactor-independent phosphoglycerate mutase [Verrucomicrobiota bacterium]